MRRAPCFFSFPLFSSPPPHPPTHTPPPHTPTPPPIPPALFVLPRRVQTPPQQKKKAPLSAFSLKGH